MFLSQATPDCTAGRDITPSLTPQYTPHVRPHTLYNEHNIMADQTTLMKEVLGALKTLQINQAQLSSSVEAISGRVNVLAGMKQVHDVAKTTPLPTNPRKGEPVRGIDESPIQDDAKIPVSPSLPASQIVGETLPPDTSQAHKPSSGTSRIILTYNLSVVKISRCTVLMRA